MGSKTACSSEGAQAQAEIRRALDLFAAEGSALELRALNVPSGGSSGFKQTHVGWFDRDHLDAAAKAALQLELQGASGIYVTLNPADRALLARAANRTKPAKDTPATGDKEITHRRWLAIDFDPVRPTGVSSTEDEHLAALDMAAWVKSDLTDDGWPEPVEADSGNGAHLLYPVNLPNDAVDASRDLVRDCLKALATRYDTDQVKVDQAVYNAARIWKLYGTTARKGDSTEERPHRVSCILSAPGELKPVGVEQLRALAGTAAPPAVPPAAHEPQAGASIAHRPQAHPGARVPLDVPYWLHNHGVEVARTEENADGVRYILRSCPFNGSHKDAAVFQLHGGGISFKCFHDSCGGRKWTDVRDLFEPDRKTARNLRAPAPAGDDGKPADPKVQLVLGTNGRPLKCIENFDRILSTDPRWLGVIAWDEHAQRIIKQAPPPYRTGAAGEWADTDDTETALWVAREYGVHAIGATVAEAVNTVANRRKVMPLRDHLQSLRWDGTPRLDEWLVTCLGADAQGERAEYVRAVGAKWAISAVARVYKPGCKVDTMLVLEGEQGIGKSLAMRELTWGDRWFSDEMPKLENKDSQLSLQGKWIIEFSELGAMTKSEVEIVKAFISRTVDRYREPYGRRTNDIPRRCVFVGTTNGQQYLRDETGNRRFWPVRCASVNVETVRAVRDQLWAEAVHRYEAGETWWLDGRLDAIALAEQDQRFTFDEWEHDIQAYLVGREKVTVGDILDLAFGIKRGDQDQLKQNRVARCLKRLGWIRTRLREHGRRVWFYLSPDSILGTGVVPTGPSVPTWDENLISFEAARRGQKNTPDRGQGGQQGTVKSNECPQVPTVPTVPTTNNEKSIYIGRGALEGGYRDEGGQGTSGDTPQTDASQAAEDALSPEDLEAIRRLADES